MPSPKHLRNTALAHAPHICAEALITIFTKHLLCTKASAKSLTFMTSSIIPKP